MINASDVSDMGLPPCRVRSLLRKRRPSRSRPSRMLIGLFIRAAATDVAWLPALGAGSDQKALQPVHLALHAVRARTDGQHLRDVRSFVAGPDTNFERFSWPDGGDVL